MTIPLDHPVWQHLFGPYGVHPVAPVLSDLIDVWAKEKADALFYEQLHHQETLYPATFAAVPWLWEVANRHGAEAELTCVTHLSWVLRCTFALSRAGEPPWTGPLPVDYGPAYAEDRDVLSRDFSSELQEISDDFLALVPRIEARCVTLAATAPELEAGYLLTGPAMVRGAPNLARALEGAPVHETMSACPSCGRPHDAIIDQCGWRFEPIPDDYGPDIATDERTERTVAKDLSDQLRPHQARLVGYLDTLASWRCCSDE